METKWWILVIIWLLVSIYWIWAFKEAGKDEWLGPIWGVMGFFVGAFVGLVATVIVLLIH